METVFMPSRLRDATYKIFPWEGDIKKARSLMGEGTNVKIYESRRQYMAGIDAWARKYRDELFNQAGIKEGIPFAIVSAYVDFYVALTDGCYFVNGYFARYDGAVSRYWKVCDPEEMTGFISVQNASEFINKMANGKG